MTTALALIQQACYEANLPSAPTTLLSLTDPTQLQYLNLFYGICQELRGKKYWPQLKKTHTFTSVANATGYQLPQDFFAAIPITHWDQTNHWEMLGPMDDTGWNTVLYGLTTLENRTVYRIFGPDMNPNSTTGQFKVWPTTAPANHTLSFDYIMSSFLYPANWTATTAYTTPKYVNVNGYILKLKTNGTSGATAPAIPSTLTSDITDGTAVWNVYLPGYETIVADTDICLFDSRVMIAGLKYAFYKARGMDYTVYENEYRTQADLAFARWNTMSLVSLNSQGFTLSGLNPNVAPGGYL